MRRSTWCGRWNRKGSWASDAADLGELVEFANQLCALNNLEDNYNLDHYNVEVPNNLSTATCLPTMVTMTHLSLPCKHTTRRALQKHCPHPASMKTSRRVLWMHDIRCHVNSALVSKRRLALTTMLRRAGSPSSSATRIKCQ